LQSHISIFITASRFRTKEIFRLFANLKNTTP